MHGRDQHARQQRERERREQRRRSPEERARIRPEDGRQVHTGRPADEGGHEHHALDADVDDARAFAHHAAQRGERDRRGRPQDDRGDVREDGDQVADELEDEADDRDGVEELVHQRTASLPYVPVIVADSSSPVFAPRIPNRRTMTGLATRKNRIVACRTPMSSAGTPAEICICAEPVRRAPNRSADNRMPIGLVRPSSAIAIASKPTVVPYVDAIWWVDPSRSVAPAKPARSPAADIVQTISRRGDMPAYRAASGLTPATRISNPRVVRNSRKP